MDTHPRPPDPLITLSACGSATEATATLSPWYPSVNENGDPVSVVYEGRVPCDDCQVLKIGLALYRDQDTNEPSTYELSRVHVGKGNDRTVNKGSWQITSGTSLDPQAVVYQLDENAPREYRSFWVIGEDILFILDEDMSSQGWDGGLVLCSQ